MTIHLERLARYTIRADHQLQQYEAMQLTRLGYRLHKGIWISAERFTLLQSFGSVMEIPVPGKECSEKSV